MSNKRRSLAVNHKQPKITRFVVAKEHKISTSSESSKQGDSSDTEKYSSDDSIEGRYWKTHMSKKSQTEQLKERLKLVSKWSQSDTKEYREGYPDKVDMENLEDNYKFYTNQIASKPDGGYIDDILEDWKGDYVKLERHHGYIQWLFPIRERGMNWHSQELQLHEAKKIKEDKEASARFLKAYQLMLDFYGLRIKDEVTGELERADNWEERLKHLNRSFHNYLRITRILKSLGELGLEHMKYPAVKFLLEEAIDRQTIPNAAKSCVEYWAYTIRDKEERKKIINKVKDFIESEESSSAATSDKNKSSPSNSGKQKTTAATGNTKKAEATATKPQKQAESKDSEKQKRKSKNKNSNNSTMSEEDILLQQQHSTSSDNAATASVTEQSLDYVTFSKTETCDSEKQSKGRVEQNEMQEVQVEEAREAYEEMEEGARHCPVASNVDEAVENKQPSVKSESENKEVENKPGSSQSDGGNDQKRDDTVTVQSDNDNGQNKEQNLQSESDIGQKESENEHSKKENEQKESENGQNESKNVQKESENEQKESEKGQNESENGQNKDENEQKESEKGQNESENGQKQSENGQNKDENVQKQSENGQNKEENVQKKSEKAQNEVDNVENKSEQVPNDCESAGDKVKAVEKSHAVETISNDNIDSEKVKRDESDVTTVDHKEQPQMEAKNGQNESETVESDKAQNSNCQS